GRAAARRGRRTRQSAPARGRSSKPQRHELGAGIWPSRPERVTMNISRRFIERPIMTVLLMAAFVIFGVFGYATLPVSELPNMDFPTINVRAGVPGADPETMASAVATPLEGAISAVQGIDSM